MPWYTYLLNVLELSACVVGFLYWKKIKGTYWKWFPIYLAIIVVTEITGEYFLFVRDDLPTNTIIYSYFGIPIEFLFFYWLFYQKFKKTSKYKWPLISAAIYTVSLAFDLSYINKIEYFFESFSYTIGCILLLVLLLIYFSGFIRSNEIINYKSSMMFWVSVGIMLFYVGAMPFFAFRTRLIVENEKFFYVYWYTQFGLNYLMYLLFMISFIWGRPK